MPEVILVGLAIVALLVFRHYAARQVAARRGRFMWAFAFPMLLGPVAIASAGIGLIAGGQLWAVLFIVVALGMGAVEVEFFRRASRAISDTPAGQDLSGGLIGPMTDITLVMTLGGLLLAIVVGIAAVIWAVMSRNG